MLSRHRTYICWILEDTGMISTTLTFHGFTPHSIPTIKTNGMPPCYGPQLTPQWSDLYQPKTGGLKLKTSIISQNIITLH